MESDIQDCPLLLLAQVMESMMLRGENRIRETRGVVRNVKIKIPGLLLSRDFLCLTVKFVGILFLLSYSDTVTGLHP